MCVYSHNDNNNSQRTAQYSLSSKREFKAH